jgi:hypothetical protein
MSSRKENPDTLPSEFTVLLGTTSVIVRNSPPSRRTSLSDLSECKGGYIFGFSPVIHVSSSSQYAKQRIVIVKHCHDLKRLLIAIQNLYFLFKMNFDALGALLEAQNNVSQSRVQDLLSSGHIPGLLFIIKRDATTASTNLYTSAALVREALGPVIPISDLFPPSYVVNNPNVVEYSYPNCCVIASDELIQYIHHKFVATSYKFFGVSELLDHIPTTYERVLDVYLSFSSNVSAVPSEPKAVVLYIPDLTKLKTRDLSTLIATDQLQLDLPPPSIKRNDYFACLLCDMYPTRVKRVDHFCSFCCGHFHASCYDQHSHGTNTSIDSKASLDVLTLSNQCMENS